MLQNGRKQVHSNRDIDLIALLILVVRPTLQEWNVKPHRGRQRKHWCKVFNNLFLHWATKSFLEYRCSGIVVTLYHHFNFALYLQPCSEYTMSPLTASLQVLDEHPRIRLAPPIILTLTLLPEPYYLPTPYYHTL